MPKAPEMLLTMLNSDSPTRVAWMDRAYSMAWNRLHRDAAALRTRRQPDTPTTFGSRKCRAAWRTMVLSKEVSPSTAITTAPVERLRPELRLETRPPRCHLGTTISERPGSLRT